MAQVKVGHSLITLSRSHTYIQHHTYKITHIRTTLHTFMQHQTYKITHTNKITQTYKITHIHTRSHTQDHTHTDNFTHTRSYTHTHTTSHITHHTITCKCIVCSRGESVPPPRPRLPSLFVRSPSTHMLENTSPARTC